MGKRPECAIGMVSIMNNKSNFFIGQQNASGNIYNISGNIYNTSGNQEETKEKVTLPSIQSILRMGKTIKGDYFKKEPQWVDFEQGFIVERREVDEIVKKLEKNLTGKLSLRKLNIC